MKTLNGKILYAKELNRNTVKAQKFIDNYYHAKNSNDWRYHSVSIFYNNPSQAKILSELSIKHIMKECDGWDYYVTGGNSCTYSAGWLVRGETADIVLIYETKANRYCIHL